MSDPPGRREANKQATRAALREAARRLFAERGYDATTVRDIAREADVTERTVYRYFEGKEGLLAEQALTWFDAVRSAIEARPADEPPLVAVREGLVEAAGGVAAALGRSPRRGDANGPGGLAELLQRSTPRPLRRLEDAITDAVLARPQRAGEESASALGPVHEARLVARVAIAALRTAANRLREPRTAGGKQVPGFEQLLEESFAALAQVVADAGP